MTNLHEVNFGVNRFCGPAVLSTLTGESTDRCAAVISKITGKNEVKAVARNVLRMALEKLKFDVHETIYGGSTLYGCLHRMHTDNGVYAVFVKAHVVAVEVKDEQIFICDNHTKTPIDIKQSARLMQHVEMVWRVVAHPLPVLVSIKFIAEAQNEIRVYKQNEYQNQEDNTKEFRGSLHYSNKEELKQIFEAIRLVVCEEIEK